MSRYYVEAYESPAGPGFVVRDSFRDETVRRWSSLAYGASTAHKLAQKQAEGMDHLEALERVAALAASEAAARELAAETVRGFPRFANDGA